MKSGKTKRSDKETPLGPRSARMALYAAVLLMLSLLPLMPFGEDGQNAENRVLSEKPALITDDGLNTEYGEQCDTYITEHTGLRGELISLYNMFQYYVFRTSAVPKVTAGRDGWLFYTEEVDGTRGRGLHSQRAVFRAAKTAALTDEYISESGGLFILAIVPDKSTVYPQMLRKGTYVSAETDLTRLRERLSGGGYYLDLYGLFRETLDPEQTQYYYKYDSHWNSLGALEAYRAIQRNISGRLDGYSYNNYDNIETRRAKHTGDLGKMLLPGHAPAEYEDAPVFPRGYTSARPVTDHLYPRIETFSEISAPSLLVLRDSFGSALIEPLSNNFSHVLYRTALPYDISPGGGEPGTETGFDIVIIETAERNLMNLISGAPDIPAPSREPPGEVITRENAVLYSAEASGNGFLVRGSLGEDIPLGTGDSIYIEAVSGEESGFFEAFPVSRSDPSDDRAFFALLGSGYAGADSLFIHVGDVSRTARYPLREER